MTIDKLFTIICTAAILYVICAGLVSLNRMDKNTKHSVRAAFIVLTVGAVCNLLMLWHPTSWRGRFGWGIELYDIFNLIWTVGVAVFVGANRRRRVSDEQDIFN